MILQRSSRLPTFPVLSKQSDRDFMGFYSFCQIKLYWLNSPCCRIPPKLNHYVINRNNGSHRRWIPNPIPIPLGFCAEKNERSWSLRTWITCLSATKHKTPSVIWENSYNIYHDSQVDESLLEVFLLSWQIGVNGTSMKHICDHISFVFQSSKLPVMFGFGIWQHFPPNTIMSLVISLAVT